MQELGIKRGHDTIGQRIALVHGIEDILVHQLTEFTKCWVDLVP